jgi:hypothetical protein
VIEDKTPEAEIWTDMCALWRKLAAAKPEKRNETARRYAVTMTEFEKVMGYFDTFVVQGCDPSIHHRGW